MSSHSAVVLGLSGGQWNVSLVLFCLYDSGVEGWIEGRFLYLEVFDRVVRAVMSLDCGPQKNVEIILSDMHSLRS